MTKGEAALLFHAAAAGLPSPEGFSLRRSQRQDPTPVYTDLNPIEQFFAKLKALLRKAAARNKDALWDAIAEALGNCPEAECRNYLAHCGYEFT